MEADWVLGSRDADMLLPLGFAVFFPLARAVLNKVLYEVSMQTTTLIIRQEASPVYAFAANMCWVVNVCSL
jgi:hypothetical protein